MRVAVVRDATNVFRLMPRLAADLHVIDVVSASRGFIERIVQLRPDVVVVDLDSFGSRVVAVCRDLYDAVPVRIVVVADRAMPSDAAIVEMFDAGADDFITGTTSQAVVLARLRAAARGAPRQLPADRSLRLGDVVVDLDARSVRVGGALQQLAPLHYELLVILGSKAGTTLHTAELMRELWGADQQDSSTRRLRIAISHLRKRLGTGPSRPSIDTVHRIGYRLVAEAPASSVGVA